MELESRESLFLKTSWKWKYIRGVSVMIDVLSIVMIHCVDILVFYSSFHFLYSISYLWYAYQTFLPHCSFYHCY